MGAVKKLVERQREKRLGLGPGPVVADIGRRIGGAVFDP
jgi:hypothetical protein